ncbi:unnamed protein product [Acanthoscelides obtectus]|uniref:Transposase n=1 Tax=Acanthoscelides obtectus TaxID=200917 RepID=A0A9P0M6V2_ACAOB|nr:unnamed protein product [Acanthoscelides obtectus]CAK1626440.1 hypothetical protein AOBTE_LOCUS3845 [Acanthoscelides obtectus]
MELNREHFCATIYYNFQRQYCNKNALLKFKRGRVSLSDDPRVGEEKPTKMVATFVSKAGHIATIPLNEQRTLRRINPERRIILHQDNASSHTAQRTTHPDLSPNDFFTFPKIENTLHGQRFQSPEEAVDAFKNAVLDLPTNEWNKCFENWFERMQTRINLRGEYFEKQ